MNLIFSKYHGAGNDFIMLDGRSLKRDLTVQEVIRLCTRHTGVGADGIIVILPDVELDFSMKYYNADGISDMMCGNGARCALAFARELGYSFDVARFSCSGVDYKGLIYQNGDVGVQFPDLKTGNNIKEGYFIHTGTHHLVLFDENDEKTTNKKEAGRRLRYLPVFEPHGVNVNFVKIKAPGTCVLDTYEKGVEDMTLACGTGAIATAIAYADIGDHYGQNQIKLTCEGGDLMVSFDREGSEIREVELRGPVKEVFFGESKL